MRDLTRKEIACVKGGTAGCTSDDVGATDETSNFLGGANAIAPGSDLTSVYVVLVDTTSRLIERVANAFGD